MSKIVASSPHFLVSDLPASVDYYHAVLGFSRPPLYGDPPGFAMPARDGFVVMLNQAEGADAGEKISPNGNLGEWDAYFWSTEVDDLFREFERNGANVAYAPVDRPLYGMCEFAVKDPDGYMLVFAADSNTRD